MLEAKHTFLVLNVFTEVEIVLILLEKRPLFRFITTVISNIIGCVSQTFEVWGHTFKKNNNLNEWFQIAKPIFFSFILFQTITPILQFLKNSLWLLFCCNTPGWAINLIKSCSFTIQSVSVVRATYGKRWSQLSHLLPVSFLFRVLAAVSGQDKPSCCDLNRGTGAG